MTANRERKYSHLMSSAAPLSHAAVPQLVLMAEPSDDTVDLYKAYLVPRRYAVEHAITGSEALAKAIAEPPDLLIAEAHLPVIDGFELCALLRHDPKTARLPIVIIAAQGGPLELDRARRAGATSMLVKPCMPEALFDELQRIQDRPPIATDESARSVARATHSRAASRRYERKVTTVPPQAPPQLRCPQCDGHLQYEHSHVGGVTMKFRNSGISSAVRRAAASSSTVIAPARCDGRSAKNRATDRGASPSSSAVRLFCRSCARSAQASPRAAGAVRPWR